MKKIFLLFVFGLFLCLASNSWSVPYTGFISNDTGTIEATDGWSDGDGSIDGETGRDSMLSWNVDRDESIWTYDYEFEVDEKDLSHIIIELSEVDGAYPGEIFDGTTEDNVEEDEDNPKHYTTDDQGQSNPGLPQGGIFGYKWNTTEDLKNFKFQFVTDRAPMWGDFYAKDGKDNDQQVYAYNSLFGSIPMDNDENVIPIGDNHGQFGSVLVPDTNGGGGGGGTGTVIPEPTTMLLLGTGLLGFGIIFRRKLH